MSKTPLVDAIVDAAGGDKSGRRYVPDLVALARKLEQDRAELLALVQKLAYRLRTDGRTADGITKEGAADLCDAAIAKVEGK